jgi:glycosyltransferase involved in cell wall biosynthesis
MDFPAPVHGMSNVNLAIKNHVQKSRLHPKTINTAPSYAAQFFPTKWWALFKVVHTIICYFKLLLLSFTNIKGVMYRPINGGTGQVYDFLYLLIARLFGNKIYIHHHSFNYLNSKSRLFTTTNFIAGKSAIHVVLGPKMKSDLANLYGIGKGRIRVISNLAFFDKKQNKTESGSVIRIGHLANLCAEKGIETFIEVCKLLDVNHIDFIAEIAGPFADEHAKHLVTKAVNEYEKIRYLGPLYKNSKDEFYANLDCFIFPSKYKNEAEPLVLFEAANTGTLLIGSQKGCMQDVISDLDGISFVGSKNLASDIAKAVIDAHKNQKMNKANRQIRLELFQQNHTRAQQALDAFIKEISDYELSETR